MIRFLQTDNRVTKALLVVIIGAASVSMVVYLIPGLTGQSATAADTYAMIYPHWYSRLLSSGVAVSQQRVDRVTQQQVQRQYPQYAGNPAILRMLEPRVGEQLIQQQVLLAEAEKLGIHATDDDLKQALQKGQFGELFFPNGQYVGDEKYKNIINSHEVSVTDFEDEVRQGIVFHRLEALITAGVTVGDQEVRDEYRKGNIKIKFDYAVISSDELSKETNPSAANSPAFSRQTRRATHRLCRKSARSPTLRLRRVSCPAECRR